MDNRRDVAALVEAVMRKLTNPSSKYEKFVIVVSSKYHVPLVKF